MPTAPSPLKVAAATATLIATLFMLVAPPASAESGGSSNSSVVGRGDILTTISAMVRKGRRHTQPTGTPHCRTVRLNDAEIEFLIALVALYPDADGSREFAALLREFLIPPDDTTSEDPDPDSEATNDTDETTPQSDQTSGSQTTDYEILLRICDGVAADIWAEPRAEVGAGSLTIFGRRMITRLPEPRPVQSPPMGVAVPVNQPVFVSIPPSLWQPVQATLASHGIVAEVRAEPVSMRVYSGDGSGQIRQCPGRGRPFDPFSGISPIRQANNPLACTFTYHSPSNSRYGGAASTPLRPDSFIGAATVLWSAEWRTGSGPWRSLGVIPRTSVFERTAREVRTAISTQSLSHHSK